MLPSLDFIFVCLHQIGAGIYQQDSARIVIKGAAIFVHTLSVRLHRAALPDVNTGLAMRLALHLLGMQPVLEGAWELVVPSASWSRAREGVFLGSM